MNCISHWERKIWRRRRRRGGVVDRNKHAATDIPGVIKCFRVAALMLFLRTNEVPDKESTGTSAFIWFWMKRLTSNHSSHLFYIQKYESRFCFIHIKKSGDAALIPALLCWVLWRGSATLNWTQPWCIFWMTPLSAGNSPSTRPLEKTLCSGLHQSNSRRVEMAEVLVAVHLVCNWNTNPHPPTP